MNNKNLKKNFFYLFLIIFLGLGIYSSINIGITHDEFHDYYVYESNKNYILNKFFGTNYDTTYLTGISKFYGSGFHYISSFMELFSKNIFFYDSPAELTKVLLSKHISVFLFFLCSGLILKKIIKILTGNEFQAQLSSIFYLVYPYLLGHSFFNIKDIPFLTVWIICTYLIIKIIQIIFNQKKNFIKELILLSIFTAYLLSIRIAGVLIFIQYLVFIFVLMSVNNNNVFKFIKIYLKEIILFIFITFFLFIALHPIYWGNPFLIIDSIKAMSQHLQTVCTVTLGECMPAQNLPPTYLPIWFFFKLPLIIIFGLISFFFVEEKIKKQKLDHIIFIALVFSVLIILAILILMNVNLYDEIRQVMFLLPLIFIISLSSLYYWSKKTFYLFIPIFILFFTLQNFKIYPYNYVWINNFSHITKVDNVFELDYWGASTKNISEFLSKNIDNDQCIISNRNDALQSFLSKNQCFIEFKNLHKSNNRPFMVSLMERALKKGTPNNCKLIYEEKGNLNFSSEEIIFAKVFRCD